MRVHPYKTFFILSGLSLTIIDILLLPLLNVLVARVCAGHAIPAALALAIATQRGKCSVDTKIYISSFMLAFIV